MRKAIPFLIPLLLSAPMLYAQQKQPLAKKQITNFNQQRQQTEPTELKMDAGLLQITKREREKNRDAYINLATLDAKNGVQGNKKDAAEITTVKADAKVAVNITGKITPELVKSITNAGGVIVSSSKESGLIVANIPATSLQAIAESPYVKQISLVPNQDAAVIKGEKVSLAVSNNSGKKDDGNIMAESVQKSRRQAQAVKQAVE